MQFSLTTFLVFSLLAGVWVGRFRHRIKHFLEANALSPGDSTRLLYDGALNTTPTDQGWSARIYGGANQSAGGGVTTINTTAADNAIAYYQRTSGLPTLDRTLGYQVVFDVELISESHSRTDRASFNLLAVSTDLLGICLSFWDGEVWAANANHTRGEGVALKTTGAITRFELLVFGSSYTLSSAGSTVLTGSLRDYSARNTIFDDPSSLSFGDFSQYARGKTELARVEAATLPDLRRCHCLLKRSVNWCPHSLPTERR